MGPTIHSAAWYAPHVVHLPEAMYIFGGQRSQVGPSAPPLQVPGSPPGQWLPKHLYTCRKVSRLYRFCSGNIWTLTPVFYRERLWKMEHLRTTVTTAKCQWNNTPPGQLTKNAVFVHFLYFTRDRARDTLKSVTRDKINLPNECFTHSPSAGSDGSTSCCWCLCVTV